MAGFIEKNQQRLWRLPSGKLTVRPWHESGLEDWFPLKMAYFKGQQVNLPESKSIKKNAMVSWTIVFHMVY